MEHRTTIYNIDEIIKYHVRRIPRYVKLGPDDLFQAGYVGYLKAVKNYNAEYGDMTLMYAERYIRAEIIDTLRKQYKYESQHIGDEGIDERPEIGHNKLERILKVRKSLTILNDREREIIRNSYLSDDPQTLQQLATVYGISLQRIAQIRERGIEKLREYLT
jgi:RNA polymerase sigma factor (sigma-70 family)